jgi:hypothetical protein
VLKCRHPQTGIFIVPLEQRKTSCSERPSLRICLAD